MKIGIVIWLVITLIYTAFSSDNLAWGAVYFIKEALTPLFLLLYIKNLGIPRLNRYLNIAISVCVLRCIYAVAVLFKFIAENEELVTTAYIVIIAIILTVFSYDRRKKS